MSSLLGIVVIEVLSLSDAKIRHPYQCPSQKTA